MPDEYYLRYKHLTHEQLYKQLLQGSPSTLSRQADAWRQAGQSAAGVAGNLRRDLKRLGANWSGLGHEEFEYRLGLVMAYSQKLADEAASIGVGAEALSRALAEAQRQSEPHPSVPVAGSDPAALRLALRNAASDWTPESVLGTDLGHVPTPEEQAAAYERMVTLVAELAALYGVVDQANWPKVIPGGPAGMPTTGAVSDVALDAGLAGAAGAPGPMVGSGGPVSGVTYTGGPVPTAPATPATMLAGVAPGQAGAARTAVNTTPGSTPVNASTAAGMAGMPMMMGGAGVIGHQPPGVVSAEMPTDGGDWWANHGASWTTSGDGTEPPEAVVGEA